MDKYPWCVYSSERKTLKSLTRGEKQELSFNHEQENNQTDPGPASREVKTSDISKLSRKNVGFVLKWTSHLTGECSSAFAQWHFEGRTEEQEEEEGEEEDEEGLSLEKVLAQSYTEGVSM